LGVLSSRLRSAPPPPLFPYTTLFRSGPLLRVVAHAAQQTVGDARRAARASRDLGGGRLVERDVDDACRPRDDLAHVVLAVIVERSEEHTSELQSRENLVCRLLLEKKK